MAVKKCHWAFLLTLYGYMTIVILVECTDPIVLQLNSSTKANGLLDVRYEGKWGGICTFGGRKPQFDDNAAKVACLQMGFRTGTKHSFTVDVFKLKLDMVLYNVTCKGNEIGISQCLTQPYTSATTGCNFAVKVDCTDDPALDGLLNATFRDRDTKAHEGILQVTKDGTKGDVCFVDTASADAVAKVVCKQMGYSGYHPPTSVNSSSSTSFYDASCQGTEQTLAACILSTATTCSTGKVINVQCKLDNATQRRFDIRLSSPNNSTSEGTVEVYQYGRWGVVCDTIWDIKDAEVVCRELGYKSATSFQTAAKFGQGTGVVFWNKMRCNGNEPSIANCAKDVALGTKTCNSANAAGVVCNTERFTTINICSNGPKVLEAGVTMIQSEAQLKPFAYSKGQTCFLNLISATNFTVYIYKKMFEENHVEHLSFISADRNETLYGDDSRQGPFDFNSENLTIEFNADTASGSGVINIMVSVAALPPTTTAAMTSTTNGNEFIGTPEQIRDGGTTNAGMIAGIVGGAVAATIVFIILVFVLWKKGIIKTNNRPHRDSSVGFYEKNIGGQEDGLDNKSAHNGGVGNKAFAANPQGNGVIPGNGVAKEPETGETERKTKLIRPASDSGINVEIERASTGLNAYELEEESNPPFNKPNTCMPVSAAYADVELGAPGEASMIQEQPKQEEPAKTEKKKKHGKDKKEPEKEKKKKWRKDKNKSKENLVEDAAHAPVGNDSCAVPMRDDFDMPPEGEYTEVGARRGVGHMNPAGKPEQNNSETYDHLDFKGRKTAPHNPGNEATYDTVHRL